MKERPSFYEKKKKKREKKIYEKTKIIDQNAVLRKEHVIIHPIVSKYA